MRFPHYLALLHWLTILEESPTTLPYLNKKSLSHLLSYIFFTLSLIQSSMFLRVPCLKCTICVVESNWILCLCVGYARPFLCSRYLLKQQKLWIWFRISCFYESINFKIFLTDNKSLIFNYLWILIVIV